MHTESATGFQILVTTKGETGFLSSETTLDLRTVYGLTFDASQSGVYRTRERAERRAAAIAHRFDAVEVVPAER